MNIKIAVNGIHNIWRYGSERYFEDFAWSKYNYKCTENDDDTLGDWEMLNYSSTIKENTIRKQITESSYDYLIRLPFPKKCPTPLKEKIIHELEINLNQICRYHEIDYFWCKKLLSEIIRTCVDTKDYKESILKNFFLFKQNASDMGTLTAGYINLNEVRNLAQTNKTLLEGVSLKLKG